MPPLPTWHALDGALDRALALEGALRDAYLDTLDKPTREALKPLLQGALGEDPLLDDPAPARAQLDRALQGQRRRPARPTAQLQRPTAPPRRP